MKRIPFTLAVCGIALTLPPAGIAAGIKAVDPSYMDTQATPCRDFYTFANGAFDHVAIPGEYASYGVNNEIDERTNLLLREILEDAAASPGEPGTVRQRVGDFYASGMDVAAIDRAGVAPLQPFLDEIAAIKTRAEFTATVADLHGRGIDVAFALTVGVDDKNSSAVIARLSQGGMGLPERDYYFRADADSKKLRDQYREHIARTLVLAGDAPERAQTEAQHVLTLETKLAQAARTLTDLQDPEKNYHKLDRAALKRAVPELEWDGYFTRISYPTTESALVVGQPEFLSNLGKLVESEPIADWRDYLRWHLFSACSGALPQAFVDERFSFYGHILSGATELPPRWKRIRHFTDDALGEDLGQLYVARAFSPEAKKRVQEMVAFHLKAMRQRIAAADWLGDATKREAYRKIDLMRVKVGYPDVWRDYTALQVKRQPFVLNVLAANVFEFRRQLAKLGRPVNHNEWQMTPPTNNAYYEPTLNEICFPAGILQPPFFDVHADDAANYGALASTIGHELTHGFDSTGRQYDATGTLRNWWTDEDLKRFNERAETIAALYSTYEVLPGLHIDGHQTLTENIADVGGLRVSYAAYKLATADKKEPMIDGFTPDQRFFIAFAQGWRTNYRPEQLRLSVQSDVHSPARWRVLGPVADFPEFSRAFDCNEPSHRTARIW